MNINNIFGYILCLLYGLMIYFYCVLVYMNIKNNNYENISNISFYWTNFINEVHMYIID